MLTYTKAKPPTVADTRALVDKHGHDDQTGLLLALGEGTRHATICDRDQIARSAPSDTVIGLTEAQKKQRSIGQ